MPIFLYLIIGIQFNFGETIIESIKVKQVALDLIVIQHNSVNPLLPTAQYIMDKYANHPVCLNEDKLLPIFSNQKMNAYLKEIATVCGINKELTFHIARHTFATTVTLSNGVPIETVSKMLGHTNLKTKNNATLR